MAEWKVHRGTYDASTNLALDQLMLEKAAEEGERYFRVYDFEQPAVILARNEHLDDVKERRDDIEYSRRDTGGSVIYCGENALFYSIAIPVDYDDFPENLHRNHFGPRIAAALAEAGVPEERLGIGEHFSVRIDNKTVAGNSLRKTTDAVLYHGVLAVDDWDAEFLDDIIELREKEGQSEKEFIDSLPGVADYVDKEFSEVKEALPDHLVDKITGGTFEQLELAGDDWERVARLVEEKYGHEGWIGSGSNEKALQGDQGFCFVDWTDEWDEDVEKYGFH